MRTGFALVVAFCVAVLIGVFGYDLTRQIDLTRRHVLTEGRVVGIVPHLVSRDVDVVYPVGGRQLVESTIGVPWPLALPAVNSELPVEYSPTEPTRADLPGWQDFLVFWAWVWAAALPFVTLALVSARNAGYRVTSMTESALYRLVAGRRDRV